MNIPANFKFTPNDEWINIEGNVGTVGITDYAQEQLSDIVFVEILVGEGDILKKGDSIATLESVKAAADVYLPASGKVVAINEALSETPEKVNSDPWGDAWMIKVELSNSAELNDLLDAASYEAKLAESK
jgi:glycine cleavage system H protein